MMVRYETIIPKLGCLIIATYLYLVVCHCVTPSEWSGILQMVLHGKSVRVEFLEKFAFFFLFFYFSIIISLQH